MQNYQPSKNLLTDRIILVTGASQGIGRSVAKAYAAHGASVILHGRDVSKLETLYDEIIASDYPQPAIIPFDLLCTDENEYQNLAKSITAEFARLDGILFNAGLLKQLAPIEHTSAKEWMDTIQVNLNSVYLLARACLPLLKLSASASIIMATSGVARKGKAYWGSYAVSKFAIEGLVQVLADELAATNIRVNAINPGATRTAMRARAYPAEDANQLATPESIVASYLYLMGDDSLSVKGQSLDAQ